MVVSTNYSRFSRTLKNEGVRVGEIIADAFNECGCSGLEQTPSTNDVVNTGKFYLDVVTASIQFFGCIVCFIG
jgi:hypothetical protein